jgi:hypothetical protein
MYYLSNDNIYNISAVFVWCTAELSVAFLVFCLPAIPKVFSGDNWIKQFAAFWHLRSSFVKDQSNGAFDSDQKDLTWDSSKYNGGVSIDTEAGRRDDGAPIQQIYPPPVLQPSVPRQQLHIAEVMKNYSNVHTTKLENAVCCVDGERRDGQCSRHHPSTSWYDEE